MARVAACMALVRPGLGMRRLFWLPSAGIGGVQRVVRYCCPLELWALAWQGRVRGAGRAPVAGPASASVFPGSILLVQGGLVAIGGDVCLFEAG